MAYDLEYDPGLYDDVDALEDDDEFAAWSELFEVLEEVSALRAQLEVDRATHYPPPRFDHQPVQQLLKARYNIYRLKLCTGPEGTAWERRLLFALDHKRRKIVLFRLMPRSDDYEFTSDAVRSACCRYDELGIPPAVR